MQSTTSRAELWLRGVAYLLLAVSGVWILVDSPQTIVGFWGPIITVAWGVFMIAALGASIASFAGRYRWEMIFIPLTFSGMAIYSFLTWGMVAEVTTRGPQALTLTSFSIMLAMRYLTCYRLAQGKGAAPVTGELPTIPSEHEGD